MHDTSLPAYACNRAPHVFGTEGGLCDGDATPHIHAHIKYAETYAHTQGASPTYTRTYRTRPAEASREAARAVRERHASKTQSDGGE